MISDLLNQARELLGRRRLSSSALWYGQMGFACPQLGIHDFQWGKNRIVNQGLNHLLNAGLRGEDIITNLYLVPFVADVTPAATLTAANFNTTLTEFTNYVEPTRPAWVSDAASTAQLLENAAAPGLFTVDAGVQTSIYGSGLSSSSVKGGAGGIIVAAAKAPSPFLNLAAGFEVKIKYRITGSSS